MSEKNPFSRSFWRSPRPPHAFVLTRERLVYVGPEDPARRGKSAAFRLLARPLPGDAFSEGPGGAPAAGPAVAGALQRLLAEVGAKLAAASLVVPDGFVRLFAADVEDAEQNPRETEEVLSWKLGRAFGDPAPELRIAWRAAGGARVLALAAREAAAASWEAPFEKAGIRIGALETAAFAVASLAAPAAQGPSFLLWADGDTATSLFFADGALRFARTRPVWSDADEALHEVRLSASYLAANGAVSDLSEPCAAGPVGSPVVEALRTFRKERALPDAAPLAVSTLLPGATVAPPSAASDPAALAALGALAGDR